MGKIAQMDETLFIISMILLTIFITIILIRRPKDSDVILVNQRILDILCIVLAVGLGIVFGYFIGATGPEVVQYTAVGTAVWSFLSGILISKLDGAIAGVGATIKSVYLKHPTDVFVRSSMFVCTFLFALLMTLNVRADDARIGTNIAKQNQLSEEKARLCGVVHPDK